jgi:hypothetical protein
MYQPRAGNKGHRAAAAACRRPTASRPCFRAMRSGRPLFTSADMNHAVGLVATGSLGAPLAFSDLPPLAPRLSQQTRCARDAGIENPCVGGSIPPRATKNIPHQTPTHVGWRFCFRNRQSSRPVHFRYRHRRRADNSPQARKHSLSLSLSSTAQEILRNQMTVMAEPMLHCSYIQPSQQHFKT